MKKLLVVSSVFLFSSLCAEELEKISSFEERLQRLELESGIVAPKERTSVNFYGDFLLWKPSLDGVAWATTAVLVPSVAGGTIYDRYKTRSVHFDYAPGFEIGAGVGIPFDHWDISFRWQRLFTTGEDHAKGALVAAVGERNIFDIIGTLAPLFSPPNEASAHTRLHLNVLDGVLGRSFLWSRYFSFRAFAGVRAVWLNLRWKLSYTMPIQVPDQNPLSFSRYRIRNRFDAVGFVAGLETNWNLYKGFGLFSYGSIALVYGKSSEKTREDFFLVPPLSTTLFEQPLTAKNATHPVKGIFDIALGLKWEITFHKDYRFSMRAGYDFYYWPSVTQKTIVQTTRTRDRSDLSFQGLIAGAGFDF